MKTEGQIWDKKENSFARKYPDSSYSKSIQYSPYYLKEDLPIAISIQGEIICIPKTSSARHLAVVGSSQTLKSTFMFALMDRKRWYWKDRCFWANDIIDYLSYDHRITCQNPTFKKQLRYLGEQPKGLPLVFLYPNTNTLKFKGPNDSKTGLYEIPISIPFEEFINNPEQFERVCGKMKDSKNYFKELKEQLEGCKTKEEVLEKLESLPSAQTKTKLTAMLKNAFEESVFDIENNGVSTVRVTQNKKSLVTDPISAMMVAGLVPSLITTNLSTKDYMPDIFGYYFRKIFEEKQDGVLNPFPISIYCDEIHTILEKKNLEIIKRIVREGCNLDNGGISFHWIAQNYHKVDSFIRDNTHYLIAARNNSDAAKKIAEDYDLDKSYIEKMKDLETFECLLLTKERFKVYSPDRNLWYYTKDPIFGKIIQGLSAHRIGLNKK